MGYRYKKTRKRIKRQFEDWIPRLGLAWWHIDINWYDDPGSFYRGELDTTIMRTYWQYGDASIHVNVFGMRHMPDKEIARIVVHELCHILIAEMREQDEDHKHEERTVTMLTKAIIWARELE